MTSPARLEEIVQIRNAILGSAETTSTAEGLMEAIGFQASLLALNAALSAAGQQTRVETPATPAPPVAVRQRRSAPEKHRKDS